MKACLRIVFVAALVSGCALADVTYDQTLKFTGGSIVDMMRRLANNPMLGRKGGAMASAFRDQDYTVYIKGPKMARVSPSGLATIMDLDAGTITTFNNQNHTYRTQTFDQMRQRLEQSQRAMHQQESGDLQFDVKVAKTGQTKVIDGQNATEDIVTMTAKPGSANAQMTVKMDLWLVPANAATHEIAEYYKRLSEKYAFAFGGSPGLGSAGAAINAAIKAALQQDGYPVLSDIEVRGVASPMMGHNANPNAPFLTMETQSSNFVPGPVDDSKFAIPAGYTEEAMPTAAPARPPQQQ